ncbi:MAG: cytochrome c biogenesis CcdA family protein [Candidatus Dormibacteria bacterium]
MSPLDLLVAFSAGAVSFFAPCVVPLLPAYVTYLGGAAAAPGEDGRGYSARVMRGGLLYVAGFGIVFVTLGVLAGLAGAALQAVALRTWLQRVGGVLVIVMGVALLGVLPGRVTERAFSPLQGRAQVTATTGARVSPLLLGLVFGTAWTPCVGPVLASILALAAARQGLVQGAVLLAAYTIGLGVPFVFCSMALASFPAMVRPLARFSVRLNRAAGALMVVLGLLLVTGVYQSISGYLAQPLTLH